jgi:HPt (histidine-containing phosphotransfer) domain-containing protein
MSMDDPDDGATGDVDWKVVRKLTGGDEGLLDELIALFPQESASHLDSIRKAIADGDGESLTRAAHTLKSSAALFGARELAECAREMETAGGTADAVEAAARLEALEEATARVVATLEKRQGAQ